MSAKMAELVNILQPSFPQPKAKNVACFLV